MKHLPALLLLAALAAGCSQQDPPAITVTTNPAVTAAPAATATALPPDTINTPRARQLLTLPGTEVLDVRTPVEYMTGHLAQARNLNVNSGDFPQEIAKLDTAKTYVLYCHSGQRATKALDTMRAHGFRHLVNGGGYSDVK